MASPADAFDRRNVLTYGSLFCGLGAIAAAGAGQVHVAGLAMAAAVVADTFDGRFARRFGADPGRAALGIELDSLADAIAFGIAPPLASVLLLGGGPGGRAAALWGAAFAHAACAITRLAAYNVGAMAEPPGTAQRGRPAGFIGIPVPLAALIWSTALLLEPPAAAMAVLILLVAAGMVSPLRIPRPTGVGLGVFTCWPLAVVILHVAFGVHR